MLTPPRREALRFYTELTATLLRSLVLVAAVIYLVVALTSLETRSARVLADHDAMLKQHLEALKELEQSRQDHRALWQRLGR
jgi:hypothetical protein